MTFRPRCPQCGSPTQDGAATLGFCSRSCANAALAPEPGPPPKPNFIEWVCLAALRAGPLRPIDERYGDLWYRPMLARGWVTEDTPGTFTLTPEGLAAVNGDPA